VVAALRDTIAAGTFIHTRDVDSCRFCRFDRGCGGSASVERAQTKVDDPKLEATRRLEAHV
jgi:hypothetical protein